MSKAIARQTVVKNCQEVIERRSNIDWFVEFALVI